MKVQGGFWMNKGNRVRSHLSTSGCEKAV